MWGTDTCRCGVTCEPLFVEGIFRRKNTVLFLTEPRRRFFVFTESTFDGSQAAAPRDEGVAVRWAKHAVSVVSQFTRLSLRLGGTWPNGPLLVMLQFVGPSVLGGDENGTRGKTTSAPPIGLSGRSQRLFNP
jgi:hypothetical protein